MTEPQLDNDAITAAAFAADREGLLKHFGCTELCAKRGVELQSLVRVLGAAAPALHRQAGALFAGVEAQRDVCIERLNAVHALVERARKVSTSDNMVVSLTDLERALRLHDRESWHKLGGNDGSES